MNSNAQSAARHLFDRINAPNGALNVMVFVDNAGDYLRVLLAPEFRPLASKIPASFEGYRVVVEDRPTASAKH